LINWLHSLLHDPARGWDPITPEYALHYQKIASLDWPAIAAFEEAVDGLSGKTVADVGSGPGHYSLEFAKRGASVTCVDISAEYLRIAKKQLDAAGLSGKYALGYIDNLKRMTSGGFDAIFCNVAWCYCMDDFRFGRQLLDALKPGGTVFVRQTNALGAPATGLLRRLAYMSNNLVKLKIGHTYPPPGRIAQSFRKAGNCTITERFEPEHMEIVIAKRGS
jgi:2-polyprenyl-3-methyl-5-hydroxy-6-metoxy-1,4-benzoquinol methylase